MENKLLLSPEDIETIKSQIKAEVMKELTQQDYHTGLKKDPFNNVREKYASYHGLIHEAFGEPYGFSQAWELIRKLSVMCVGLRYVRDLDPVKSEKAAEIAEDLCKYLIEKRKENA